MSDALLDAIRDLIQEDVGNRGLRTDPAANLITACPYDFQTACHSIADTSDPAIGVVTGFFIPHAQPPCGETDGPLGALFLARALVPLGIRVALVTDTFCKQALEVGLAACGLGHQVPLLTVPRSPGSWSRYLQLNCRDPRAGWLSLTHLIALERVGPAHTPGSIHAQPGADPATVQCFLSEVGVEHRDRCHTMKGRDITAEMAPAHLLFEAVTGKSPRVTTIGIGDGGNEIGMGKIPWDIIRRNIPNGGQVACRVATDCLIVSGISNWGAYGLAAGVRLLRGYEPDPALFDSAREHDLLRIMVEQGPLVDGVSGQPTISVDGLSFERYAEPLRRLAELKPVNARMTRQTIDQAGKAMDLRHATGVEVRQQARSGWLTGPTPGLALGHVQTNLVVVPRELAFDFLLFCQRNPKPCPLLDVTEVGSPEPRLVAPGADLRTDLPRYGVYQHGELSEEPWDLLTWWREDLVAFLLGCSFTFENALLQAGVPVRHIEASCNVPMYRTNRACNPAGVFRGPMVVSMRPLTPEQIIKAIQVCERFPRAHGTPIHFGDPEALGIPDLNKPDFGDPVDIRPGELPVFWACGVTPQAVAMEVRPSLLITHKPGHMFVTDWLDKQLEGG